nr:MULTISPECIES: S41 family peptidase [Ramlibacter]
MANVCTVEGQKRWVRSYLDESYLWWDEVREVDSSRYATAAAYYDALLVKTLDGNGQPRDRFSTSMSTAVANILQGVPAAAGPAVAVGSASPVPFTSTLVSGGGRKVGYVLFNEHRQGAQDALITAFQGLKTAAIQDLVLDLRYNPGGFLYIAQTAAAMVAGPSVEGQVFERLTYSARRAADTARDVFHFSTRVTTAETTYPVGTALPQLDLPRVYILASQYTCSASESIINSLRGIGVQVILVGDRTCGKPYGFHRRDNCGQAYFPIEFKISNALGFDGYSSGFPVQCRVVENPLKALGATDEPLLAAALTHIDSGACPAGSAAGVLVESAIHSPLERAGAPASTDPMYQPGWDGRKLLN